MQRLIFAVGIVAGICLTGIAWTSDASQVRNIRTSGIRTRIGSQRTFLLRRMESTPSPCPQGTDYAGGANGFDYFIGVTDSIYANEAISKLSGVLAGAGNFACGVESAVVGGENNSAGGEASSVSA